MMELPTLHDATLKCLAAQSKHYNHAKIIASTPITGGYSRINNRIDLETQQGTESVVLQYSPPGETGLVRVDRRVEQDLLHFLSASNHIHAASLIASDLDNKYFDSAAYIFKMEPGRPYVEVCRETDPTEYAGLNQVVAGCAAKCQTLDIQTLPASMERPTSWNDYMDQQIDNFREVESRSKYSRPFLRYLCRWLDENRPPEAPLSLVHGDFQVSNMLSLSDNHEDAVVVDWELAHIGDPREDLGWLTMVCGAIPPNILEHNVSTFYKEYRARTGLSEDIVNPATSAYFLIISSIRTHYGMMRSSDALAESPEQAQSALAAYYLNITTYQHMNWMNSIAVVEEFNRSRT